MPGPDPIPAPVSPSGQAVYPVGEDALILHLHYPTCYGLCASFMRLQEFYESDIPGIRGSFFTLEEFMDAYAQRMGNFTYTVDWGGFNVPGTVFRAWCEAFPEATRLEKERTLVAAVESLLSQGGGAAEFYLIGSSDEASDLRDLVSHEAAHALFALSPRYRKDQTDLVKSWQREDPAAWKRMSGKLLKMGYVEPVLEDEVQAYFATSDDADLKRHFRFDPIPERSRFVANFLATVEENGIVLPPAAQSA